MAENMIEIKNLYKKYKNSDEFSVNDISLNIDKNEIYGILGPNGAGKTTLISMPRNGSAALMNHFNSSSC